MENTDGDKITIFENYKFAIGSSSGSHFHLGIFFEQKRSR
jgi:hypothetical protein